MLAILFGTSLLVLMSINSAIWAETEGWSFGVALWCSYITITTIGLGDYAPESDTGMTMGFFFLFLRIGDYVIFVGDHTWSRMGFWRGVGRPSVRLGARVGGIFMRFFWSEVDFGSPSVTGVRALRDLGAPQLDRPLSDRFFKN